MKNMFNRIGRKFRSRSGETLTETLVSVLIISVVSVGLAAMISTASNINAKAKEYDEKLDAAVKNLEIIPSEPDTPSMTVTVYKVEADDSKTTKGSSNYNVTIRIGADTADNNDLNLYGYSYSAG